MSWKSAMIASTSDTTRFLLFLAPGTLQCALPTCARRTCITCTSAVARAHAESNLEALGEQHVGLPQHSDECTSVLIVEEQSKIRKCNLFQISIYTVTNSTNNSHYVLPALSDTTALGQSPQLGGVCIGTTCVGRGLLPWHQQPGEKEGHAFCPNG